MSVRSSGTSTGQSARNRLGAGLVSIPEVPRPDPRAAVMENAEVPERKRFCSRSDCGAPVGRSRGDREGRTEGFCTKCGHPYSFVPKLRGGDIVHGQYEVAGCLAHGGLGWIYLAVDRAVSDRWVVLKGLLDTGDQDAMEAAISERRFLAEIEHSNIVRIYNFVEHLDQRTGSMDGYIVMEYVGGKSLKEIANDRRTPDGRRDPLPVEQACAYGIEALEALGHLHSRNLLYCDFKVDNAIQSEDQLKLIDMGAVRRMDDDESAIYGTVGYQAPEVAEVGPSVASDLYTVARTLAVMTFDFQGYTNVFADSLPDPEHIEVFRTYESFYRFLVRATDPDPARRVAIVLDDRVVSAPAMQQGVPCGSGIGGGSAQITGGFSGQEARDLAALVQGGALPVPVTTVEQSTVGPTLGAEAIRASALAAVIGLACTGLFVMLVYRLLGVLATVALLLYGLISYAAVVALGATLTLPGLAGFVLAIGIAVDANVLVFERAREEYAALGRTAGRDLRRPLETAFGKVWSAVADSHITTLLAAGLLFVFASGPVKGFGVTLAIGVVTSLLSAMVITRLLADLTLRLPAVRRRPSVTGIAGLGRLRTRLTRRVPRLMAHRRRWLLSCGALLLVALAGIGVRGLEFGVEFTGGRVVQYTAERPVDADEARAAVADAGFPDAVVQTTGGAEAADGGDGAARGEVSVRVRETGDEEQRDIREALTRVAGPVEVERDDLIGPSLGGELRTHATIALGLAVVAQLLYLTVRFRWTYATAAVAAMTQDVLLVVGLFAWLGKPVDSVFLAALLTVVGYSVNDSVVVLDRLRELRRRGGRIPLPDLADRAVAQTLPRTVNTGMGALFVLVALAVLGGDSLTDFSVALLAGVVLGMASTVFTAMPLAVALEARHPAPAPAPVSRRGVGAVV
ncbi:protein translocase subunit SecF [Streptomyces sp. SR27]|uniref:protein translocase subunit SecF n=1 Tax=Streptomyces sp. SR27 TaxID=3076630 RepID=UPI003FA3ABA4